MTALKWSNVDFELRISRGGGPGFFKGIDIKRFLPLVEMTIDAFLSFEITSCYKPFSDHQQVFLIDILYYQPLLFDY